MSPRIVQHLEVITAYSPRKRRSIIFTAIRQRNKLGLQSNKRETIELSMVSQCQISVKRNPHWQRVNVCATITVTANNTCFKPQNDWDRGSASNKRYVA